MQTLRTRSTAGRRRWPWIAAASAVVVAAAGVGVALVVTGNGRAAPLACNTGVSCHGGSHNATAASERTLSVVSTTPATGASAVPPDTTLTVQFSSPVKDGVTPSINPGVAGSWNRAGDKLVFTPSAPFVPYTKYTLTVPSGPTGVQGTGGAHLAQPDTLSFTVADGSTQRLQQLLAELGYLPLSYATPGAAPKDLAMPQAGTLQWRWSTLPQGLTDQWVQGSFSAITKGAVMSFETQNGLAVDGIPGPSVWSALLADVASHKADANPYTYVSVTKTLPQHLTAWVNGALQFANIPVNTGVPGATTRDGTFQVFEHVKASDMKGTNITGSTYNDPTVPWASYFNGGDALHGFPRAGYGYPQSNGCVEMRITTAGSLWPYTPIGTVVTVVGPTTPPPTTTTTAPPAG